MATKVDKEAEVKRAKKLLQLAEARAVYQRNQAARRAEAAAQAEADIAETVNVEFSKVNPKRSRKPAAVTEPASEPVAAEPQPDAQPAPKRSRAAKQAVKA